MNKKNKGYKKIKEIRHTTSGHHQTEDKPAPWISIIGIPSDPALK